MTIRKLQCYLSSSANLQPIQEQVQHLLKFQSLWPKIAPGNLAQSSRPGVILHQTLFIYAENGAIAAKLRLLAPQLLKKIQKYSKEITAIKLEVQARRAQTPARAPKVLKIDKKNRMQLAELAQRLEPSPLQDALKKLLRHHQDSPD